MNLAVLNITKNCKSSSEADLTKIPNLITADDIQLLAKYCPQLESLILDSCEDEALEFLFLFPKLRKLSITTAWGLSIEGKWVESICSLSRLTHLTINGYQDLDSTFLQKICQLNQLISIDFAFCDRIFDEDLHIFSKFKHLRFLNLTRSDYLTDDGMNSLAKLTNLEGLELAYTLMITDKGFQLLSSLCHLKYLNLRRTQISHEGFKSLSSLNNLEILNLNQCYQLTDSQLLYFKTLPKLRLICVGNAPLITEEAIQEMPPSIQIMRASDEEIWEFWDSTIKKYR